MESDLPVLIKPLEVEFNGVGQYRHAETVQDLAAMLLGGKWPEGKGKKFHAALWRSMEAIEWYVDADRRVRSRRANRPDQGYRDRSGSGVPTCRHQG
ncbi:DUF982 domain-containing protein [Rhizobium sp. BK068]|uniref:DUF982 domain-containing protein n=1 Tax=Rhizobium sp. BK068 TaxID=2512130 RepID=UPI001045D325|nr:DUF982 domain-containing protein [Rhizobium sp. BK068]TCM79248.1 uncharacterized protein DUF982 [Rhizobium sp. BK068]